MSEERDYKQTGVPDFMLISKIVKAAKGENRTMAVFAIETGINASTLSRIVNGKLRKPLTADYIEKIMDKKDVECHFSKSQLFRANGMTSEGNKASLGMRGFQLREIAIKMQRIISNELFSRDVKFRLMTQREVDSLPVYDVGSMSFPLIAFEVYDSKYEENWVIKCIPTPMSAGSARNGRERLGKLVLVECAALLLHDAWHPEELRKTKTTFAFTDPEFYYGFRERLEKEKVFSQMSTILIDLEKGCVSVEEPLSGSNKCEQDQFFLRTVNNEENNDWEGSFFADDFFY